LKTIRIGNVPDAVHRQLKSRAALSGVSLSRYLLAELKRLLERPTRQELLERIARRTPLRLSRSPADLVREERDSR
jgi:antitoxin FitA